MWSVGPGLQTSVGYFHWLKLVFDRLIQHFQSLLNVEDFLLDLKAFINKKGRCVSQMKCVKFQ